MAKLSSFQDVAEWIYLRTGLRQPRWPKPHVMKQGGRWYLVDTESDGFGTWVQSAPITHDPRLKP